MKKLQQQNFSAAEDIINEIDKRPEYKELLPSSDQQPVRQEWGDRPGRPIQYPSRYR